MTKNQNTNGTAGWALNLTQEERLDYLLRSLAEEEAHTEELALPASIEEKKKLLRAFFNIRPPEPVSTDFLAVQNAYLTEETRRQGIIDSTELPPAALNNRLCLWQGDITRLKVDGIVNAANSALLGCFLPGHNCIDNVIHTNAGVQLRLACHKIMEEQGHPEATGTAKITPAFNLPSSYILHTVGPIIGKGGLQPQDHQLLASSYRSCLELAEAYKLRSLAFCCISTGVFGFPQQPAAEIAVSTVLEFLENHPDSSLKQIIFDVFTDQDRAIYEKLLETAPARRSLS